MWAHCAANSCRCNAHLIAQFPSTASDILQNTCNSCCVKRRTVVWAGQLLCHDASIRRPMMRLCPPISAGIIKMCFLINSPIADTPLTRIPASTIGTCWGCEASSMGGLGQTEGLSMLLMHVSSRCCTTRKRGQLVKAVLRKQCYECSTSCSTYKRHMTGTKIMLCHAVTECIA